MKSPLSWIGITLIIGAIVSGFYIVGQDYWAATIMLPAAGALLGLILVGFGVSGGKKISNHVAWGILAIIVACVCYLFFKGK